MPILSHYSLHNDMLQSVFFTVATLFLYTVIMFAI